MPFSNQQISPEKLESQTDGFLTKLSNETLNLKIKNLVGREREITAQILEHIREVERRKLYLQMAYSSMFAYLTEEVGYPPACAMRRIDAARLSEIEPEIINQIHAGEFNLSQASQANQAFNEAKKNTGAPVPNQIKKEILKKLVNKTKQQTETILAKELNIQPKTQEKQRAQADESIRIEMTFTKEEMALLKQVQAQLSHKTAGGNLKDTILELARAKIQEKQKALRKLDGRASPLISPAEIKQRTSAPEPKAISPKIKNAILKRDGHCQFVDPIAGRKCESTHFLEIDHIKPRSSGGSNRIENLRVLCDAHNRFRYSFESLEIGDMGKKIN